LNFGGGVTFKACIPRVLRKQIFKRPAFTIAEILVTLIVIGVVAAMTLPGLVNFFRLKQLETQFKEMDARVQQALKMTAEEYGIDDFTKFDAYSYCGGASGDITNCRKNILTEISDHFLSNFKIVNSCEDLKCYSRYYDKKYSYTDFAGYKGSLTPTQYYGFDRYNTPNYGFYTLIDGSAITAMTFMYHSRGDSVTFTFDTNGPESGPNRYGYDIFIWTADSTWYPLCTTKLSAYSHYNGRGCYKYAKKNQNPDNTSKEYWKSLKL